MEYESQKQIKKLWGGEKAFLIWAGSEKHQHFGSSVGTDHLKHALEQSLEKGYITKSEKDDYLITQQSGLTPKFNTVT